MLDIGNPTRPCASTARHSPRTAVCRYKFGESYDHLDGKLNAIALYSRTTHDDSCAKRRYLYTATRARVFGATLSKLDAHQAKTVGQTWNTPSLLSSVKQGCFGTILAFKGRNLILADCDTDDTYFWNSMHLAYWRSSQNTNQVQRASAVLSTPSDLEQFEINLERATFKVAYEIPQNLACISAVLCMQFGCMCAVRRICETHGPIVANFSPRS
ncbi:hypothetical protein F4677DRAFT_126201 [Hypoxylon crocopeplum]|nr:hypothetical protein F4677DRAFT_126201 [Hypoxylon crocopeplum]